MKEVIQMSKAKASTISQGGAAAAKPRSKSLGQRILDNWQMYALLLIPVVLTIIYKYIPMYGMSISDEEAREKYNKSAGELKSTYEVAGPKLILSEYYSDVFHMEDRALQRLNDLENYWFNYVEDKIFYPVDCVFTSDELDTIDMYRADFEAQVKEQEALWLKSGGPTDEEWEAYKQFLADSCGMDELQKVYQEAYNRYAEVK